MHADNGLRPTANFHAIDLQEGQYGHHPWRPGLNCRIHLERRLLGDLYWQTTMPHGQLQRVPQELQLARLQRAVTLAPEEAAQTCHGQLRQHGRPAAES